MPSVMKSFVNAVARGRVTIGPAARDKRYSLEQQENGQIILTPVVSVPEREAWLFKNPGALAAVQRGLEAAAAGRVHYVGSFAQYSDLDIDDEPGIGYVKYPPAGRSANRPHGRKMQVGSSRPRGQLAAGSTGGYFICPPHYARLYYPHFLYPLLHFQSRTSGRSSPRSRT